MYFIKYVLGKRPLGRLRVDGRIILIWIFKKWDVWCGLD
jgi:hypothetical protein